MYTDQSLETLIPGLSAGTTYLKPISSLGLCCLFLGEACSASPMRGPPCSTSVWSFLLKCSL